jgi:hypothetical protein
VDRRVPQEQVLAVEPQEAAPVVAVGCLPASRQGPGGPILDQPGQLGGADDAHVGAGGALRDRDLDAGLLARLPGGRQAAHQVGGARVGTGDGEGHIVVGRLLRRGGDAPTAGQGHQGEYEKKHQPPAFSLHASPRCPYNAIFHSNNDYVHSSGVADPLQGDEGYRLLDPIPVRQRGVLSPDSPFRYNVVVGP